MITHRNVLVIDASLAEDDYHTFLQDGPMLDIKLPPGTVDRLSSVSEEITSLDYVALDVYEKLLRAIPGIRIGRVVKGHVVWEDAILCTGT